MSQTTIIGEVKLTLPDPACYVTGWSAEFIDGRWCVGMTGNLDTIHDAVIKINSHTSDGEQAKEIAHWIVGIYNATLNNSRLDSSSKALMSDLIEVLDKTDDGQEDCEAVTIRTDAGTARRWHYLLTLDKK